nr:MAG TPA: hypothetical protein [Caudoviricetes sp.]
MTLCDARCGPQPRKCRHTRAAAAPGSLATS